MIDKQVRRVPVVDGDGRVVGMIAQADLARDNRAASDREVGRIVEKISEPTLGGERLRAIRSQSSGSKLNQNYLL